jgi:hypothetical protein
MGMKRDTTRWRDNIGPRRGNTKDGKGRRRRQLDWHEFYWAKKWRKSTRSIQLLQMDGEDLKETWVNIIFLKKHIRIRSSFVHLIM